MHWEISQEYWVDMIFLLANQNLEQVICSNAAEGVTYNSNNNSSLLALAD